MRYVKLLYLVAFASSVFPFMEKCKTLDQGCFRNEDCCSKACRRLNPIFMQGDVAVMDLVRRSRCANETLIPKRQNKDFFENKVKKKKRKYKQRSKRVQTSQQARTNGKSVK